MKDHCWSVITPKSHFKYFRAIRPSLGLQNQWKRVITRVGPRERQNPHLLSFPTPTLPAPPWTPSEHPTLVRAFSKAASLPPSFLWALGLWLGQAGTAALGAMLSQVVRVTATHTS